MANEAPNADASAGILEAAKSARALAKRSLELTAADTMALCADPILEALGWDIREPRQVRRSDGSNLRLIEANKPVLSLHTIAMGADLPESITPEEEEIDWMMVTNGVSWSVFSQRSPSKPLRTISLETAATAKEALDTLLMLQKGTIRRGPLAETLMPEALDESVTQALARHLEGSDVLIAAIQGDLAKDGIRAEAGEIKAALTRSRTAQEIPAEPEAAAPAKPARKASPRGGAKTKKPARAKPVKAAAEKTGAGASAKSKKKPGPKASAAKTASAKPAAGKQEKAASTKSSPAAPEWPAKATHVMQRRKVVAYIAHDQKTGKTTLLPGSVLNGKAGKALNPMMVSAREQSMTEGNLEKQGDMLVVTSPMEFDNPRLAATFAAATLVKDMSAWVTKSGKPLAEAEPKAAKPAPEPAASESEAAAAEVPPESAAAESEQATTAS